MKETCFQFGRDKHLIGIVTEPDGAPRREACLLVNAGLVPKFGPFRLYAQLARRLAAEGFVTLRFDLGGIGDSRLEYAQHPLGERTQLEIGEAVDRLFERRDLDGVVLGGLCSGAEDSFRYAEGDARVRGAVLIDPFSYRTPGWRWRHLRYRLARRSLRALGLYRPHAPAPAPAAPGGAPKGKPLVNYKYMGRAESGRILRALLAREARVHFVYTGGMLETFNHERQLRDMFEGVDFRGLVTLDHFPRTDHTQLLEEDRRRLVDAVVRRIAAPPPADGAAHARRYAPLFPLSLAGDSSHSGYPPPGGLSQGRPSTPRAPYRSRGERTRLAPAAPAPLEHSERPKRLELCHDAPNVGPRQRAHGEGF